MKFKEFIRKAKWVIFGASDEFMILNKEILRLEQLIYKNKEESIESINTNCKIIRDELKHLNVKTSTIKKKVKKKNDKS